MKNTITGLITIIGISVGLMSVAEASDRDRGHYSEKRIVKTLWFDSSSGPHRIRKNHHVAFWTWIHQYSQKEDYNH